MSSSPEPAPAPRLARSLLFVPGDRPERFAKAFSSGAHQVILDLEDAVAPAAKDAARKAIAAWLGDGGRAVVRINAIDSPGHAQDLALVRDHPAATVMLPKADPESAAATAAALAGRPLIALVETAAAMVSIEALAGVRGVVRLAFGSIDFTADSGIEDQGENLTGVRTMLVLASRAAGLQPPIDGVSVELSDAVVMQEHARRARSLGFGGKLCIHPRQVEAVHAAFRPLPQELEWARRVVAAFAASDGAAVALDGRMIDKPVVDRARQVLAEKD